MPAALTSTPYSLRDRQWPDSFSVPEEAKHSTFVGRITQDLELELADDALSVLGCIQRTHGTSEDESVEWHFVNSRIHWEKLCGQRAKCSIHLEVIVDRPPQVFHVDVEMHVLIKILWSLEQEKQVNLFLNLDCWIRVSR